MYREFELIDRIVRVFGKPNSGQSAVRSPANQQPSGVALGIGDDCAVLHPGAYDLVTTDTMVEDTHFRRDWSSPEAIGFKAMAVSLSDVAAMGGRPGAFFLNLTFGPDDDEAFVDALLEGMRDACDAAGGDDVAVSVFGGDVTSTKGPTVITTTLLGKAAAGGALTRSGASVGDRVVILGPTGLAQAGLELLEGRFEVDRGDFPALLEAHRHPQALVRQGVLLGELGIPSALIDLSDGLAQDLGHILERSGVGATIEADRLPRHEELERLCERTGADILRLMLQGGEDLQLCMAVPPAHIDDLRKLASDHAFDVFDIGEICPPEQGLRILDSAGASIDLDIAGYQHFADQ
jgi:thiamine-monophosphate kinase